MIDNYELMVMEYEAELEAEETWALDNDEVDDEIESKMLVFEDFDDDDVPF